MARQIWIEKTGAPEVMQLVEREPQAPGPGMARIRVRAAGLNFIDTYHRSGLYPIPLPTGLGSEGAGVIEAVGEGVALAPGTRVAWCSAGLGSYAEVVALPAQRLVPLPDALDEETAAALMLKGQTVEYLLRRTRELKPGETCLFHAAAGGVGLLFGQWASAIGAEVIGTVGSEEKAELARQHGYRHIINYRREDVAARVREITAGRGVPVVYDGVGRDTFTASLDSLAPRGLLVSFGNASGAPPALELQELTRRGSLYVTRPTLATYTASAEDLQASSAAVFEQWGSGRLRVEIHQRYPLEAAVQAHRDLEARRTTGSSVLLP